MSSSSSSSQPPAIKNKHLRIQAACAELEMALQNFEENPDDSPSAPLNRRRQNEPQNPAAPEREKLKEIKNRLAEIKQQLDELSQ